MYLRSFVSSPSVSSRIFVFFFFNDTATTEIYTLSLHDALPIYVDGPGLPRADLLPIAQDPGREKDQQDRKSTRLNSSHLVISYAVFCLKKKKRTTKRTCPNPSSSRILAATQRARHTPAQPRPPT